MPDLPGTAAREHLQPAPRPQVLGGEIRRSVLPGGLRVVTERIPGSPSFSVGCFVGVGSRHEPAELHGASHFLEHVLFKGTARRSAEDISSVIESVGGDINAYTSREYTCFYARVLGGDADLAVDVLTDMLATSTVREVDVEAERAVILDEIAMHADDPGECVQELATGQLFGGSGLGRPVIGSVRSITRLTRDQVVGHWRRHYRPSELVVAAAGQVDHDRLVDQLAALDADSGPAPTAGAEPGVPVGGAPVPGVHTLVRHFEQCSATLAMPSPGVYDDRRHAAQLLSMVLGGGMSSRLFLEVRERRGLAYGIDADEVAYSDAGLWSVDWQCAPDRLAEILGVVRQTLLDVARHGVTATELARVQGQMRGQAVLSHEGPSSRMSRLGVNTLHHDERSLGALLDRYDAVTGEEVRREARALFAQPPVLAVVGPKVPRRRLEAELGDWCSLPGPDC